ncbi:dTDP-4-dehydrorhamnose reductase [bioreactor metagenome]|uniref:dTDP-4-dehydrorhamnose reductase n=1 Tax=bioreactor metagenome TaxID=1076179 RepID=A0A644WX98_9ZZZZ|nr:dTDP-4-dehydrorhamnose reductase [Paludibacter sp.]
MQTVLVTGSKGQLGNEVQVLASSYSQFEFIFTDVEELDICDRKAVENYFAKRKIDVLLNCAAYAAVDKAEEDVELCYRINEKAVGILGEIAAEYGTRVVHVSTDYVFDGTSYRPYTEDMPVCPATVYGKSKLAGEQLLMDACPAAVIVRTSWLYSSFGNNFVKTMMRLGKERGTLNVIFDQVGTPTYAADLADTLLQIISADKFVPGIYHYSNEGVCSWYDFTISIHKMAGINCRVLPIESKDYPAKTPRPHYSVLNKNKIKSNYNIQISHWEDGLRRCMDILTEK